MRWQQLPEMRSHVNPELLFVLPGTGHNQSVIIFKMAH
jgi:hypothetical protein